MVLVAGGLGLGGCSDEGASSKRANLPPNDEDALAEFFGADLERLGLRLTRGGLVNENTGYEDSADDQARHLAVYAEPTGSFTPAEYAAVVVPSARVFLPRVFDRWPGLESMDLCLEPPPGVDDRKKPPAETVLYITRAAARRIGWRDLTFADLVAMGVPGSDGLSLGFSPAVAADPSVAVLLSP